MKQDQQDLFSEGKSVEEAQLDIAIKIVEKAGYRVVRDAEEAKKIAIESGYQVTEPILVNDKVITLKDLRNYFFMRLWNKYPDRNRYYVDNIKNEFRLMRLFVESREEKGLNRFNAIQQCVAIIDTIFDHEKEFNFKNPIDIRVIGQAKASWITEKALQIINNTLLKEKENEANRKIEEMEDNKEIDLLKKSEELSELLAKMEANNG
jgi:hypothetical protein